MKSSRDLFDVFWHVVGSSKDTTWKLLERKLPEPKGRDQTIASS